ncbi:helicase-related protein [Fusobacterium polymorphum]
MWLIKAHTSQEAPTSKSESSSPKASVVIHLDPWWNISAQNQATDRAHRIGQ